MIHGPLHPIASVLPMIYTDTFRQQKDQHGIGIVWLFSYDVIMAIILELYFLGHLGSKMLLVNWPWGWLQKNSSKQWGPDFIKNSQLWTAKLITYESMIVVNFDQYLLFEITFLYFHNFFYQSELKKNKL